MQTGLESLSKEELIGKVIQLANANEELTGKISWLDYQLAQLKRAIFGKRNERYEPNEIPGQLRLPLNVEPEAELEVKKVEVESHERKKVTVKQKPFRGKIPEKIKRIDYVIEPQSSTEGMVPIGKEVTEVLEITPAQLYVNRYTRIKYADPTDESKGIIIGEPPAMPLPKCIAGASVLTTIIIDKFVDHMPLYRQIQRFKREGISISPSTMSGWIAGGCELLSPLYDLLARKVLQSDYLLADETPIPVLDKEAKGRTHRGFHWVYQSPDQRLVLFDYRPGRGREGPEQILKNFKGHLQTDGYAVYNRFKRKQGIILVGCLAHARRYFEQALDSEPEKADYVLTRIQKIYAVEREARDANMNAEQRLQLRKEKSLSLFTELGQWIKEHYDKVLPKSAIGKAVHYFLGRFNYIGKCFENGKLEIDINLAENSIRPIAIGRKNYLFAGSHEGARRAAMLYSFLATCKQHGVNPYEWLKDVLTRIPTHHVNKLEELLPYNWKQAGNISATAEK